MAIISPDRFNPLKRFVAVRLQQGVPLVDADWNELEDVRKFEVRAYLKWFVGDGVPEGTDGFRVLGGAIADDFVISTGVSGGVPLGTTPPEAGLRFVGRCLVDGMDVLIESDTPFRAQPLHTSQPGAAALAAILGVPVVPELPPMNADLLVYLDVWERLVTATEDADLIFDGIGTEGCARLKREWVVRWRNATTVPAPPSPDFLPGHSYYAIARIRRRAGDPVTPSDVTDLRSRRLLALPSTLVEDVLGTTADKYRRGEDRPALSLRTAINALLRGELPSTPDRAIAPDPAVDSVGRAFQFDGAGGLVAVWDSTRSGIEQVYASRLSLDKIWAGFGTAVALTSGVVRHNAPDLGVLPNGDLAVVYQTNLGQDIFYKRAPLAGLAAAAAQPVAALADAESQPRVLVVGDMLVFFYYASPPGHWFYRRLKHTTNAWIDAAGVQLTSGAALPAGNPAHVAVDAAGAIWFACRGPATNILALRYLPGSNVVSPAATLDLADVDSQPFVLPTTSGEVWALWRNATTGLVVARNAGGVWGAATAVPGTAAGDRSPTAVEDPGGGVWMYFVRGGSGDLFVMRRDAITGGWSTARQVTFSPGNDAFPHAVVGPQRETWLFWNSDRDGNTNNYFKQVFTTV